MLKRRKPPKVLRMTFTVPPEQGAASLFFATPEGYEAVKLERRGTKAVVTYERIDA